MTQILDSAVSEKINYARRALDMDSESLGTLQQALWEEFGNQIKFRPQGKIALKLISGGEIRYLKRQNQQSGIRIAKDDIPVSFNDAVEGVGTRSLYLVHDTDQAGRGLVVAIGLEAEPVFAAERTQLLKGIGQHLLTGQVDLRPYGSFRFKISEQVKGDSRSMDERLRSMASSVLPAEVSFLAGQLHR